MTFYLDSINIAQPKPNQDYYSTSKQCFIEVQQMPEQHVRNALQKILNDEAVDTKSESDLQSLKESIHNLYKESEGL